METKGRSRRVRRLCDEGIDSVAIRVVRRAPNVQESTGDGFRFAAPPRVDRKRSRENHARSVLALPVSPIASRADRVNLARQPRQGLDRLRDLAADPPRALGSAVGEPPRGMAGCAPSDTDAAHLEIVGRARRSTLSRVVDRARLVVMEAKAAGRHRFGVRLMCARRSRRRRRGKGVNRMKVVRTRSSRLVQEGIDQSRAAGSGPQQGRPPPDEYSAYRGDTVIDRATANVPTHRAGEGSSSSEANWRKGQPRFATSRRRAPRIARTAAKASAEDRPRASARGVGLRACRTRESRRCLPR